MRRRARSSWAWGRPPVRYVSYMCHLPGLLAEVRMQVRPRASGTNSPRILLVARAESNGLWSARKRYLGNLAGAASICRKCVEGIVPGASRFRRAVHQGSRGPRLSDRHPRTLRLSPGRLRRGELPHLLCGHMSASTPYCGGDSMLGELAGCFETSVNHWGLERR
jgi:hypothetical protein